MNQLGVVDLHIHLAGTGVVRPSQEPKHQGLNTVSGPVLRVVKRACGFRPGRGGIVKVQGQGLVALRDDFGLGFAAAGAGTDEGPIGRITESVDPCAPDLEEWFVFIALHVVDDHGLDCCEAPDIACPDTGFQGVIRLIDTPVVGLTQFKAHGQGVEATFVDTAGQGQVVGIGPKVDIVAPRLASITAPGQCHSGVHTGNTGRRIGLGGKRWYEEEQYLTQAGLRCSPLYTVDGHTHMPGNGAPEIDLIVVRVALYTRGLGQGLDTFQNGPVLAI